MTKFVQKYAMLTLSLDAICDVIYCLHLTTVKSTRGWPLLFVQQSVTALSVVVLVVVVVDVVSNKLLSFLAF